MAKMTRITAMIPTMKYFRVYALKARTNWVGAGKACPKSENMFPKIGITYMSKTVVTMRATAQIVAGYTIALLICLLSFITFSM